MTIQWFPGHMAKARREVAEKLKQVDLVLELLDARIPNASRNPMIDEIVGRKPRFILLNKADLADPSKTEAWITFFNKKEITAIPVDAISGKGLDLIPKWAERLTAQVQQKREEKGMKKRAVRAMILGIPNVGKSSLINRLAKRAVAKTGDRPGVTKAQQWIKAGNSLELLDTPGILWPKFEDERVGYLLAATGAIRDEILDPLEVAYVLIGILKEAYRDRLMARYLLQELPQEPYRVLDMIGQKRGILRRGGEIDIERTAILFLKEVRDGKLGGLTLETPPPMFRDGHADDDV